jgi:hypothetical protein
MSHGRSLTIFFVVLLIFVSGCGGTTATRFSNHPNPTDESTKSRDSLVIGRNVRLELLSGSVVSGEVKSISNDSVMIGRTGNYGYEETNVILDQIAIIEYDDDGSAWTGVAILGAFIAVLAAWTINELSNLQ